MDGLAVAHAGVGGEVELLSVVVCTAGERPELLKGCLASLSRLNDPRFEIIVVDNAAVASVSTASAASVWAARYVREPRRGQDAARNCGIAAARGSVIAFIDDDCEADPGWTKGIRRALVDPDVSCVTGRVRAASLDADVERWFEESFSFDRGPIPRRFASATPGPFLRYPGQLGTGCNMAFRRSVFERVGWFDEALEVGTPIGGGGDLDMFARVLDAGIAVAYEPDAEVLHHHRSTVADLRRQFRGYGTAFGALTVKFALGRRGQRIGVLRHYVYYSYRRTRRLAACLLGRNPFPARLVADELGGILRGPFAYVRASVRRGVRRR